MIKNNSGLRIFLYSLGTTIFSIEDVIGEIRFLQHKNFKIGVEVIFTVFTGTNSKLKVTCAFLEFWLMQSCLQAFWCDSDCIFYKIYFGR